MLLDRGLERLRTQDLRRGSVCALQVQDLQGPIPVIDIFLLVEPACGHRALIEEVGSDVGEVETVVRNGYGSVHDDDRDARCLYLGENGVPSLLDGRRDDDKVHTLEDEISYGRELIILVLPCIDDAKLVALILGKGIDHGLGVGYPPVRFGSYLREADDEQILVGLFRLRRRTSCYIDRESGA